MAQCTLNSADRQVSSSIEPQKIAPGGVPPDSNTGVLSALVDWLSFTFPLDSSPIRAIELLGASGWSAADRGRHGYKQAWVRGPIAVLYDGNPGMGVHVVIPGSGCRDLENREIVRAWPRFIAGLLAAGAQFTRLDIAMDDDRKLLSMDTIRESVKAGLVASRYEKAKVYQEVSLATGEPEGDTIYFGSRNSDTMVRFYDKGKQMGLPESFVRCEIELKGRQAGFGAALLASSSELGTVFSQFLASRLLFKIPGAGKQRGRWQAAQWWQDFLGAVERLKLCCKPVARSVAELRSWVARQCAPTLALLHYACVQLGEDEAWFKELLAHGWSRFTEKHWRLVRDLQTNHRVLQLRL